MVTIELVGIHRLDGLQVVLPDLVPAYYVAALDSEAMRCTMRVAPAAIDLLEPVPLWKLRFVPTGRVRGRGGQVVYIYKFDDFLKA